LKIQSDLSIATTQDHGRAWSLWTGGLYIRVNYIGNTQGGRREQVVDSTGGRYIQVVAKAGLTVLNKKKDHMHDKSFNLQDKNEINILHFTALSHTWNRTRGRERW
jgi:hypothetical protein